VREEPPPQQYCIQRYDAGIGWNTACMGGPDNIYHTAEEAHAVMADLEANDADAGEEIEYRVVPIEDAWKPY
jgi:hypothetical protein